MITFWSRHFGLEVRKIGGFTYVLGWDGPQVRMGSPRPALLSQNQVLLSRKGSAADVGVRPTTYADVMQMPGSAKTKWGTLACNAETPSS